MVLKDWRKTITYKCSGEERRPSIILWLKIAQEPIREQFLAKMINIGHPSDDIKDVVSKNAWNESV